MTLSPGTGHSRIDPGAIPTGYVRFIIERMERPSVPQAVRVGNAKIIRVAVDGYCIGCIGLQLYSIRAGLPRRLNRRFGPAKLTLMISGDFGDDKWRMAGADFAVTYPHNATRGLGDLIIGE
jgi:hypothetical protein